MKTFQVKTDNQTKNYGERISKLLQYCNADFLRSDEALQSAWNSQIFNMVFSNILRKSVEQKSSTEDGSKESALAAVELIENKVNTDSTFLVDFYAKFQLRNLFKFSILKMML